MQIGSVILKRIFLNILDYILHEFSFEVKYAKSFLKGIFAAEGGVGVMYSENYISCVGIHFSSSEIDLVGLVKKLLDYFEITYSIKLEEHMNSLSIIITNWNNYWKLFKLNIFDLSLRKKNLFLKISKKTKFWIHMDDSLKSQLLTNTNKRKLSKILGIKYITLWQRFENNWIPFDIFKEISQKQNLDPVCLKEGITLSRAGNLTNIKDRKFIDFLYEYLW